MAYDWVHDRFVFLVQGRDHLARVLFSTADSTRDSIVIEWDGENPGRPPHYFRNRTVFDAVHDRILVLGEALASTSPVVGWEMRPSVSPRGRLLATGDFAAGGGSVVYDTRRRHILVYGGVVNGGGGATRAVLDRVAELSLDGRRSQPGTIATQGIRPEGRFGHAAVYDSVRDRMLVIGGVTERDGETELLPDLWELRFDVSPPAWRQIATFPGRHGHSAIIDTERDRILVFGGYDRRLGEEWWTTTSTWVVPLSGPDSLEAFQMPVGPLAYARARHTAAYDPVRRRMLVHGGSTGPPLYVANLGDLWSLIFDWTTGIAITFQDAAPTTNGVVLSWRSAEPMVGVTVRRRLLEGEWSVRGTISSDGSGWLRFHDREVVQGGRYAYHLLPPGEVSPVGEAQVVIPSRPGFRLQAAPNPARRRLEGRVTLAEPGDFALELFDIEGRRVVRHSESAPSAGAYRVPLSLPRTLAPGIYRLRLSQGARRAATNVVLFGDGR